jgi:hypothetical protein
VFRTIGDQPSLWESLLPDELLVLPAELARVDALLEVCHWTGPPGLPETLPAPWLAESFVAAAHHILNGAGSAV